MDLNKMNLNKMEKYLKTKYDNVQIPKISGIYYIPDVQNRVGTDYIIAREYIYCATFGKQSIIIGKNDAEQYIVVIINRTSIVLVFPFRTTLKGLLNYMNICYNWFDVTLIEDYIISQFTNNRSCKIIQKTWKMYHNRIIVPRKLNACLTIQKGLRNWLLSPITKDGKQGIYIRILLKYKMEPRIEKFGKF
jgi:hypothetical protein